MTTQYLELFKNISLLTRIEKIFVFMVLIESHFADQDAEEVSFAVVKRSV
jgi:hypothetical protein